MAFQEAKLGGFINGKGKVYCLGTCCAQLLWIMQQLHNLSINQKNVPIQCDNMSAKILQKIHFNTLEQSILRYVITSFVIMLKKVTCF